jgi:glycosyltransferase involved in cell wall biosynthesis
MAIQKSEPAPPSVKGLSSMRIALISPFSNPPMRGNITTVRRIAHFLGIAGAVTLNLPADTLSVGEMECHLSEFKPDLVHGFHAFHCGAIARQLAERYQIPYIITITGSDIHDPIQRNHPGTARAIEAAQVVVGFNRSDAAMLSEYFPNLRGKISVVPQGIEPLPFVESHVFGLNHDEFILLLPTAVRSVKRIEFPLQSLSQMVQHDPALRLVIAGGILEQEYATYIRSLLCDTPFSTWLGEVPYEQMGSLYRRADLVLNCSRSESMPNSIMEAMALGRPVLAVNIPGNRSLVKHGENGWLYNGEEDFRELVLQIRANAALREELGARAFKCMAENFSPVSEAERYLSLYTSTRS